jgi:hypothetical protein
MGEEYNKERTAALIKEGQEIAAHLKVETQTIKRQMERVLEGGEEETLDALEGEKVEDEPTIVEAASEVKSRWRFWR